MICFSRIICSLVWVLGLLPCITQAIDANDVIADPLVITELMVNPLDPNAEFVELANRGGEALSLAGMQFVQGIGYRFGNVTLAAGEYAVLVRNLLVFTATYGDEIPVLGQYEGSLDNSGERIVLVDSNWATIADFTYDDNWYDLADGEGFSLVRRDEAQDVNLSEAVAWRPSTFVKGSPGTEDPNLLPMPGAVVINEVLANSGDGKPDWIELLNTSSQSIALGGWRLSDDTNDLSKYSINPAVVLAPGAFLVFNQDQFEFGLADSGDTVVLQAALDGVPVGYRQVESFGASLSGVTLGRYTKSTGSVNFVALTSPTPNAANALPQVGPVVISEIMYHPAEDAQAEYIELLNISTETVYLSNAVTQRLWRLRDEGGAGVDYIFDATSTISLAPAARLVLTRNRVAFMAAYSLPVGVTLLAWDQGALGNGGDQVQLDRLEPLDAEAGADWDWIRVERISYSDGSHPEGSDPWPIEADGHGMALERIDVTAYGNDPANWQAAEPTPGY